MDFLRAMGFIGCKKKHLNTGVTLRTGYSTVLELSWNPEKEGGSFMRENGKEVKNPVMASTTTLETKSTMGAGLKIKSTERESTNPQ